MADPVRKVAIGAVLMLLAACAARPPAGPATATASMAAVGGQGCLGREIEACAASLGQSLTIDRNLLAAALARRDRVDANGKPLGPPLVALAGNLPGRQERLVIVLHAAPDGTVAGAESSLFGDPSLARTEQDYDRTGLYEALLRLRPSGCPDLDRIATYRFFENSVKPKIVSDKKLEANATAAAGHNTMTSHAAGVPYCGATFSFIRLVKWEGSPDLARAHSFTTFATIRLDRS
ncbi:MAG: hypothetical protein JO267_07025 [Alphaproteobacteria bacterium]|nr:hypothetical protein [Alphaproteobacteria bacterium]